MALICKSSGLTEEIAHIYTIAVLGLGILTCLVVVVLISWHSRASVASVLIAVQHLRKPRGTVAIECVSLSNILDRIACHLLHDRVDCSRHVSDLGELALLGEVHGGEMFLDLSGCWWEDLH
jgi:hypothetical protein